GRQDHDSDGLLGSRVGASRRGGDGKEVACFPTRRLCVAAMVRCARMNAATEIGLVVGRELKKTFRSAKGIVLLLLTLLGGAGISLILAWSDTIAVNGEKLQQKLAERSPSELRILRQEFYMKSATDLNGASPEDALKIAEHIASAPLVLYFVLFLTVL